MSDDKKDLSLYSSPSVLDEYDQWLLDEHLKNAKEHISIPWDELKANEPERPDLLSDPVFLKAVREINSARESGKDAPQDALSAIKDMASYRNPLLKFTHDYNHYRDKNDEGQGWAEHVLTKLTHAKTLDDLHSFATGDWYVCAMLLQSDLPVPRKIIGKLLEEILKNLDLVNIDMPALGIKKAPRGRPANPRERERYLSWLMFEVQRLTTKQGMTATEAYAIIAEKKHKSPDTIRRDYERFKNERERRRDEFKAKQASAIERLAKGRESFMREKERRKRQTGGK